jgi:hypothetical protein
MSDGEIVVPMTYPKVLALLLAELAQAGFTFQVSMHSDRWIVKVQR